MTSAAILRGFQTWQWRLQTQLLAVMEINQKKKTVNISEAVAN